MHVLEIPRPYLIFVGDNPEPLDVKTGVGILEWRPDWCMGQYRFEDGCDLGLPDHTPATATAAGAATMVIGGASFGGKLPPRWEAAVAEAIEAGLNVASGLHDKLHARPALVERAKAKGVRLFDVRSLPPGFAPNVASGEPRSGKRLLTVGTDCAVGKKFTALALERDMRARGMQATFRATGQTGVLISGGGLAIDAIVADFLAGAVELLSPANEPDHWDVIEGQGSLFHPAYAAVSLGLLHGSQPDAFVVCHEATRTHVLGYERFETPDLQACIDLHVANGRRLNADIRCVGVSLNTSLLAPDARGDALAAVSDRLGLPCVDPVVTGTGAIIDRLLA
jgi:uncharacterized NAD-dependent epimerase/dehydratase family protein